MRVPIAVVLAGILLTALMASIQRESANREQALVFERQVALEHERFTDQIEATVESFDNAVTFLEATFPSSIEEFRLFFADAPTFGGINDLDPGITLIEEVSPEEVDGLAAREVILGNPDLRVLTLGTPLDGKHLVITRTAQPVSLSGYSLIGLDVGSLMGTAGAEIPIPENGRTIYVLDDSSALGVMFESGASEDAPANLVVIIESVNHPESGEVLGWAAQFFDPVLFIRDLPEASDPRINVSVEMLGATELISVADAESSMSFETAGLRSEIVDNTNDLSWTLRMWAVDDLGVSPGLFGPVEVWIFAPDPLTGLLNRQGFMSTVDGVSRSEGGTVFFIDLDGFKAVNDSRGHAAGDRVLRDVAERLREQFRNGDVISRFGGDEFVVFTPGLGGGEVGTAVSQRVVEAISEVDTEISASLGTAVLMYQAKELGGDRYQAA